MRHCAEQALLDKSLSAFPTVPQHSADGRFLMKSDKKFHEMQIVGIASDNRNLQPVVILREKNGARELYIWIGPVEAMALQRAISKEVFQRPLTHELLRNIIDKAGLSLEHIEIDDLRDHTYYATIYLKDAQAKLITVDARPSDSLVLATWSAVPIFVSEAVIEGMAKGSEEEAARRKVVFTQEDIEQTDEELTKILERMNPDDLGNA
jgi:bifunctional DNase/RNase